MDDRAEHSKPNNYSAGCPLRTFFSLICCLSTLLITLPAEANTPSLSASHSLSFFHLSIIFAVGISLSALFLFNLLKSKAFLLIIAFICLLNLAMGESLTLLNIASSPIQLKLSNTLLIIATSLYCLLAFRLSLPNLTINLKAYSLSVTALISIIWFISSPPSLINLSLLLSSTLLVIMLIISFWQQGKLADTLNLLTLCTFKFIHIISLNILYSDARLSVGETLQPIMCLLYQLEIIVILLLLSRKTSNQSSTVAANTFNTEDTANKSQFRHDLRSPLSDIVNHSELLLATPLDQEQRESIHEIQHLSYQALTKINEIFLQPSTQNNSKNIKEPFNLHDILIECCQYTNYHAQKEQKEILLSIEDKTPPFWLGQSQNFRHILIQCIEHALRHAVSGNININCTISNDNLLSVYITYRPLNSKPELEITQLQDTVLSPYGAKLTAEYLETQTRYHIMMPAEPYREANQANTTQHTPNSLKGRSILIVDDNPTSCELIAQQAENWQMDVSTAGDFDEAMAKIIFRESTHNPFDILLIDYILPHKNGLDLALNIASEPKITGSNTILLMSNGIDMLNITDAKNLGIKHILEKPVSTLLLRSLLEQEIAIINALHLGNAQHVDPSQAKLKALVVEDNPISNKIICTMLEKCEIESVSTNHAESAINQFKQDTFNLVFMDCDLPGTDGFQTTMAIRQIEKENGLTRTLIYALTAHDDQAARDRCFAAGMDDFLAKPIRLSDLQNIKLRLQVS